MNYWTRPIRTSRDGDYGNTRLGPMEQSRFIPPWWRMLGLAVLIAAMFYAVGLAVLAGGAS